MVPWSATCFEGSAISAYKLRIVTVTPTIHYVIIIACISFRLLAPPNETRLSTSRLVLKSPQISGKASRILSASFLIAVSPECEVYTKTEKEWAKPLQGVYHLISIGLAPGVGAYTKSTKIRNKSFYFWLRFFWNTFFAFGQFSV